MIFSWWLVLPELVVVDEAPGVLDEEADAHEDAVEGVVGELGCGGGAADEANQAALNVVVADEGAGALLQQEH